MVIYTPLVKCWDLLRMEDESKEGPSRVCWIDGILNIIGMLLLSEAMVSAVDGNDQGYR